MRHSIVKILKKYFSKRHTFRCKVCSKPLRSTTIQPLLSKNIFTDGAAGDACLRQFCIDCIARHIEFKVMHGNRPDVRCIGLTCKHSFQPLSCRPILPAKVFEKWCDVLCSREIAGLEKSYCPNRKCSELIVNESGGRSVGRSECPSCKTSICYQCKNESHDGYSCSEMKEMRKNENDRMFEKLAKTKKWKSCPSCGHQVERVSGCCLITCRCGTTFCYKCGGKLKPFRLGCGCKLNRTASAN